MLNKELANVFEQMADLLEIKGQDRFRINAHRRVARSLRDLNRDVADLAAENGLQTIPGVGKGTAERIAEFLDTGRIADHQELLQSLPHGLLELLDIPSLGPKKVKALHDELGVAGIGELKAAIEQGKVDALGGFGAKTTQRILDGIAFRERSSGRTPLGMALPLALMLRDEVARMKGVRRSEVAGSARRGRETVGDLDLLCEAKDATAVIHEFTHLEVVRQIIAGGEKKGSILVAGPKGGDLQVDLRVVPAESFGAALQYFTGSKEHNVRLREMAVRKKWRLNEYGLFDGDRRLAGKDEAGIYRKLGLPCCPPEMREDRGEFELDGLPENLVTLDHILGDLHTHTPDSDGRSPLEDMVEAARDRGYRMLAVTDHSASSAIANGLSADRLAEQIQRVRRLNRKLKGFTLLAGTECDILADGALDFPDDLLAELDWVVASIHSAQTQDRARMTRRCIAALENPFVCALGHPSGRLLGQRDAMDLDWDAVIKTAARTGTALEVNASWQRLDLKDSHVRQAMDAGCWLCINTDAHHVDQLDQMQFGIMTARRGWATKDRILNAKSPAALKKWIKAKRG